MEHEKHMKRCYELAVRAGKKGFDTFGAVLVHNGQALEEAETRRTGTKESSAMRNSTWCISVQTGIPLSSSIEFR
jgi:hypothetical protein